MKARIVTSAAALMIAFSMTATTASAQTGNVYGPPVTATTDITMSDLTTTTPLIPSDLYRTSDNQVDHKQAAKFAWLEFIALVSPNGSNSNRGVPGGSFSSVKGGMSSTYPLVWETFQHRSELFPYNSASMGSQKAVATQPQPWSYPPKYVYLYPPTVPSGVDYTLYNNLDEASQIFQNNIFFPNPNNPSDPYEILFEAKANFMEWTYVNDNYNKGANGLLPNPASLPTNTIEIKAAWRPVESIPADQLYRYHVSDAIFYEGPVATPTARNGKYALIALHIIHKTANYPSFVFATFEQVDQYVNQVTNQPSGVYFRTIYHDAPSSGNAYPPPAGYQPGSYYFAVDTGGYSASGSPTSSSFVATTNPTRTFDVSTPHAWPNGVEYVGPNGQGFYPVPLTSFAGQNIAVTQPPTTNGDVDAVNAEVLALMQSLGQDFVWQYYKLKGVQAIPTSDETTKDYYLANITVESSQAGIQLFRGGLSPNPSFYPVPNIRNKLNVNDTHTNQSYSMGGCMGCHGAAQALGGDFSFIYADGGNGIGFNADPAEVANDEEAKANAKVRQSLIARKY